MNVVINGEFLEEKMQGIVRYAINIISNLDPLISDNDDVILLCPEGVKPSFQLKNIKVNNFGNKHGIKWELFDLKKYLKKNKKYICLNLCNVSPLIKNRNVTTIHDVMYRDDYKSYKSFKNKLSALWHRYQYRYNAKNALKIFTVSNYSKGQIEKYYPKSRGKIFVTYNGWEHILNWGEDKEWNKKYPFLKTNDYFFSLASLSKNKNGKWVLEVAKRNPDSTFAIAGRFYNDKSLTLDIPSNVHLLGFVDDSTAASLIKNCKAFLFPSTNEGFGLPPLEALCLGAIVVSSNYTSMPEILGDAVHYIDPFDYDVDLKKLLSQKVANSNHVKEHFSWKVTAISIYESLQDDDKHN